MKIIFNHTLKDWYWQIFDEWKRKFEIIIPEFYKESQSNQKVDYLDSLENAAVNNPDVDFIFDFNFDISQLIQWKKRNIKIPIVLFAVNAIMRPHVAKMSALLNVWYVERYAKTLMESYNKSNLIYDGMAANPYIFYPIETKKKYDVSFIGRHYGERRYWLNEIRHFAKSKNLIYNFPSAHGEKMYLSQNEINMLYNKTKINLSFAPKEPPGRIVNLRTFEICMSGNFQLMQYTPCVEEYFDIDKEIVCWKNERELIEKIQYFLENEEEREKIAKNGYKRAIENHNWTKRGETISNFLKNKRKINIKIFEKDISNLLSKDEFKEIENTLNISNINLNKDLVAFVLRKRGYKRKNINKKKSKIRIRLRKTSIFFKPQMNDFQFVEFYHKTMMVIRILPSNTNIELSHWKHLERITYLIENDDISIPRYGVLTNGKKWIIKDFKKHKWVKGIPNMRDLKKTANLKILLIIRVINFFKSHYQSSLKSFVRKKIQMKTLHQIKQVLNIIEFRLRKYMKAPQMHRFD